MLNKGSIGCPKILLDVLEKFIRNPKKFDVFLVVDFQT